MNKKILAAVVCAATVLSLAGCGEKGNSSTAGGNSNAGGNSTPAASSGGSGDTSTPADSNGGDTNKDPYEGLTNEDGTLTIAVWGDNGDIDHLIKYFKENSGTDVEVTYADAGEGGEAARDAYPEMIASGDVDIIICDADWVRVYIEDDTMMDLADLNITKADLGDTYDYVVDVATDNNGVLKGASFQACPGAWFYDVNLAKEHLGVNSPEEMQAKVKDWDTFRATAKELNEKTDGSVALTCTQAGLWQVFQCNRTKPWVVDGVFQMDTAEEFFDIAKDLYDNNALTAASGMWADDWYPNMQTGKAMGEFAPTWGLTGLKGSILGDAAKDRTGDNAVYALVEGPQMWYWGGSWFCVPKSCNTKKAAAEWIRFYCVNEDSMKGYSEEYGDFMSNKKVMDAIVSEGKTKNPSLVGGQDHLKLLSPSASAINLKDKLTTYDSKIKTAFNNAVQKYMKGTLDKDAAIAEFKKEVRAAYPDLTVE